MARTPITTYLPPARALLHSGPCVAVAVLAGLLLFACPPPEVGEPPLGDDDSSPADDDDSGPVDDDDSGPVDDDDSAPTDDDDSAAAWCGTWDYDPGLDPDDYACEGALPPAQAGEGTPGALCDGGTPVDFTLAGFGLDDSPEQLPDCGQQIGCSDDLFGAALGSQAELDAAVGAFRFQGRARPLVDFDAHEALFVANSCGAGFDFLVIDCVAQGAGGELIVGVKQFGPPDDATAAETAHLSFACLEPGVAWTGIDIRYEAVPEWYLGPTPW
jgi:hypothetical protein